jgi:hypothetical protein
MKPLDPDDLKIPHRDIHSLIAAFEQAWQEERNSNETQLPHNNQGQAPATTG